MGKHDPISRPALLMHHQCKQVPATYPVTAPEIQIPELDGKTGTI